MARVRRDRRAALAWLAGGLASASTSRAADERPARAALRIVVAYPPGGISDTVARALAGALAARLGSAVRVENQAGAGGAIALRTLAHGAPDGRTLVFSAITPYVSDAALGRVPSGVVPVASVMLTPSLLVGTPAFRGTVFDDLVTQARAVPGALRWATSGIGTTGHLVLEQVCRSLGIAVTHVPYKGGGQQLADALGGQFELLGSNVGPLQLGHVAAGRFKALAIGAPARLAVLPGVPTLAELGCPRANLASLFGLFAAGGTTPARVEELNAAIDAALKEPALRSVLIGSGNLPTGGSAAAFAAEIERAGAGLAPLLGPAR